MTFLNLAFAQDSPGDGPDPADPIAPALIGKPAAAAPDKRVFGVLPNYRTAERSATYEPLTAHQKFVIATKDTFDYPLFILGGGLAGLAQIADQHENFGQGMQGFAGRYATAYTDQFTGNYLTEGILPILLHEDPRYFRIGSGGGGAWYRIGYAASRIFVTKTDSGRNTFNFAEVLGNGISAAIANGYYVDERSAADNVTRLSTQLATDALSQVLKEFWPDIKRKYFARHRPGAQP